MTPRQWLRLVLVGLGASVVPLDTAVNIGFPDITRSFGLPIQMIQWVVICYVLTYASLMLAFGRVGDIFGHARVFRAGLAWSVAAFLLCAAAPDLWLAAVLPLSARDRRGAGDQRRPGIGDRAVPRAPAQPRGRRVHDDLCAGLGRRPVDRRSARQRLGLAGGVLVSRADRAGGAGVSRRAAAAAAASRAASRSTSPGAVLLALAISSLLLLINELPRLGRRDWLALPLFALAVIGVWAFLRREARTAAPIVNLEFFRSLGFATVNVASVLVYLTSFSVLLFVPYYLVRFTGLPLPWAGAVLAASFAGDDGGVAARRAADRASAGESRSAARRGARAAPG